MYTKLLSLFIFFLFTTNSYSKIYYVKPEGKGDGTSWGNAAGNIQAMIDNSNAGDEIWVASGIYQSGSKNNEYFLSLKEGVHMFGGFSGSETSTNDRIKQDKDGNGIVEAWEFLNETIISGNNINLVPIGKIFYVVTFDGNLADKTFFDGFTVTNGNCGIRANNLHIENCIVKNNNHGGGITYSSGIVNNCLISNNKAYHANEGPGTIRSGGINSTGEVNNCIIRNNESTSGFYAYYACAGGIYTTGKVNDCIVENNICGVYTAYSIDPSSSYGGGIYNAGEINNCIIRNNVTEASSHIGSYSYGGGIYNTGKVKNCIIMNNSAKSTFSDYPPFNENNILAYSYGGGIYNSGSVSNCVISNNSCQSISKNMSLAYTYGGGIYNSLSGIVYCSTIVNNSSDYDYEITTTNSFSEEEVQNRAYNCIINPSSLKNHFINPSSFKGIIQNEGQKEELELTDWNLKEGSQYIDSGSKDYLPNWLINGVDLAGNARIIGQEIDMGAYEYNKTTWIFSPNIENRFCYVDKHGKLNLKNIKDCTKIQLWNIKGQLIKEILVSENGYINLPEKGIYIVKFQIPNGGLQSEKIIW